VTEGSRDQRRDAVGPGPHPLRLAARVAAWLTVPLYVAGEIAYYFFTYSVEPWGQSSVVDHAQGMIIDAGFGVFAVVGALLLARRPANAIGWIMASIGLMVSVFNTGSAYASYVVATRGRPDVLAVLGAWCANWYWFVMLGLALIYLPMLFPNGRLISRRWLPFAVIGGIGPLGVAILGAIAETLTTGEASGYRIDNPIGIEGLGEPTNLPAFVVFEVLFAVGVVGAAASVVVRLRRSRGVERRQLEWFAYTIVVFIGSSILLGITSDATGIGWLGSVSFALSMTGLVCLPIAVGVAILRHRLYDIDLIINRTLVYGPLTAALALVYFGGVVTTETAFRALTGQDQQPQLAVVVSTLAIAALFSPLRRRIKAFIDRRFYRNTYDARKTLEAFSAKLRDETNLDALNAELVGVIDETMQPEHVALWLRPDGPSKDARED
jgi:MFS family permease